MCDSGSARSAPRPLLGSRPAPSTAATTSVASDVVSRGGVRASLRGRRALREGPHEGARSALKDLLPEEQLGAFISKYAPAIAAQARAVLAKMRAFLPGASELVCADHSRLHKMTCMQYYARNAMRATRDRKCGSTELRPKAKEARKE